MKELVAIITTILENGEEAVMTETIPATEEARKELVEGYLTEEEYYFDKKEAEGYYNISFSGLLVYIFDLNEDYGFVGFDEGHDIIKTTKTKIKYDEEGEPYLDFSHDEILLNEIVGIVK